MITNFSLLCVLLTAGEDFASDFGISRLSLGAAAAAAAGCLGLLAGPGLLGTMSFSISSSLSSSPVDSAVKLKLEPVVLSSC